MLDRYLSYRIKGGSLTSIDRLEICCRQLEERLVFEENPNNVTVICADAMALALEGKFEIVTMVGSTLRESGSGFGLLETAMGFVKTGGSLYFQSIESTENCSDVIQLAFRHGLKLAAFWEDDTYGIHCRYYKFDRT